MKKLIEMDGKLKVLLMDPAALPSKIEVNGKSYTLNNPKKAGYKAAIWQVTDEFGRKRALKLTIAKEYRDKPFLREMTRAGKLEPYEQFARLIDVGRVTVPVKGLGNRRFVAFIEEWVIGSDLDSFLEKHKEKVNCIFLLSFVESISNALAALQASGLIHDDLHGRNVMVADPLKGSLDREYHFRVVDMGSLKQPPTKKIKDDHAHFVEHIVSIRNALSANHPMSIKDKRFIAEVDKLTKSMMDGEPAVALKDPKQISEQFRQAFTRSNFPRLKAGLLPLEEALRRLGSIEVRRLKQLEEENRRLKQTVAAASFDKHMLKDELLRKNEACS